MSEVSATHFEVYGRWSFTYYVYPPARPGMGFLAEVHVREGEKVKRIFMESRSGPADKMNQQLRDWAMEYVMDLEDPTRVERRNQRSIGDRALAGLAGEKGV